MKRKVKKGQDRFEVVDGALAGRQFVPGKTYGDDQLKGMTSQDLVKFEEVKEPAKPPGKTAAKSGGDVK